MSIGAKFRETSLSPNALEADPSGDRMKPFIVLAVSSLIVVGMAMLTFRLADFSIGPIDIDAIAWEFAARSH